MEQKRTPGQDAQFLDGLIQKVETPADPERLTEEYASGVLPESVLGRRVTAQQVFRERGERWKILETFPTPGKDLDLTFKATKFTAMCPVTGQPDFYEVTIYYTPQEMCIESKSLKLYLETYRDEGHFCEALAVMISKDIHKAVHPQDLRVTVHQSARGDVSLEAEVWAGSFEFQEDN